MIIQLPYNNWRPRQYQMDLWRYLEHGGKRGVALWHRRAGKDELCLHWAAVASHMRVGTYWHMLPEAAQARKAIWESINPHTGIRRIDEAFPVELRETTRENEMMIKFRNGSTWQVVGSDNFNSLVGSPPVGIVFSEYSLSNPAAWAYMRPILAENGGWALFIYTPRGKNHGKKLYDLAKSSPDWFCQSLTADDTGVFSQSILDDEKRQYMSEYGDDAGIAYFNQEYNCSFESPLVGSYYGGDLDRLDKQGRIGNVPHDPTLPVFTAWDLGYSDDTSIWFFQAYFGEVRIIDYYASSGKDLNHYAEQIHGREILVTGRQSSTGEPTSFTLGKHIDGAAHRALYNYGGHWLPHDANPKTLAANGRSIVQQLYSIGVKCHIVPNLGIQDGIQSARALLKRCSFDAVRCKDGIDALGQYQRKWDADRKCFKDQALHDWTSHAADAFRYMSLVWRNPRQVEEAKKPVFLNDMRYKDIFDPTKSRAARQSTRI